ncbi:MAG: AAA family ATPase [Hyphomicrobiaceae bacterium]|nr:AAA family ATPase [Hyphomicrobiaceae bacterium]
MSTPDVSKRDLLPAGRQRRFLVVLFADLSRSTRLAARMEAEDYAELLTTLRATYDDVISRHGGNVLRVQGDGLLACFGYPNARENDGRRATEAALELHAAVRDLAPDGQPLSLHTGIHAGLVLLERGDDVSGRMVVFGTATNIAARISDKAKDDEILVSKETLGAERHFFVTDGGRTLHLADIDDPIGVWQIKATSATGSLFEARSRSGLTPFVGRQTELDTLNQRLKATIADNPKYLAISAPPGQGKSRLAEEFLCRITPTQARVLRGHCESYLSAPPLQPFLHMLRSLCGIQYGMSPATAALALEATLQSIDPSLLEHKSALLAALSLSSANQQDNTTQTVAARSMTAAMKLFDTLAARSPLVLFIDDWQWADDATRQLLAAIRSLPGRRIFSLVATRQIPHASVGLAGAEILTLTPLGSAESETAIRHLLKGANTFEVSEIRADSGGNPLFLEELCHSATHDRTSSRRKGIQSTSAWLNKLIEARVERLPHAQKELVRIAAVIGNIIPARILQLVTGYGPDHPMLADLAEQDLIYPAGQPDMLRFKHGIARDVIYETVGIHLRKALHLRIAEALRNLASREDTEEELYEHLAYHFGAAQQWNDAARYAESAGDKAIAVSALDRAQIQYQAALNALDRTDLDEASYRQWKQIAQRLGLVCVFDPSNEQLQVLQRAIKLAIRFEDDIGRGHAEYWVGYIYYGLGNFKEATRYLEIALRRAKSNKDDALIKWCSATLGQASAAAGDYDQALNLLGQAIDEKRKRGRISRPAVGYAYTLACNGSVLGDQGRFEEADDCFKEAVSLVRGSGHEVEGSVLCWRSGVQLWRGHWDAAIDTADQAQRVAERVKSLYLYSMSRSLGGYAKWMGRQDPDALQAILEATTWLERDGKSLFISLNYGWLSEILVARGQFHAARQYAARALKRARSHDRIGGAMACRAMARAAAAGQHHKSPGHYLVFAAQNAMTRNSMHETALNSLCQAELFLAIDHRAAANEHLQMALQIFDRLDMTWHAERTRSLLAS